MVYFLRVNNAKARKHIFLVRHGESEGNKADTYQQADTPLTKTGFLQARAIAERIAYLTDIEAVVSSDMLRARQTAERIAERVGVPHFVEGLFRERRRASFFVGKRRDDPAVQEADKRIRENFGVPGFRFDDEETYDDLVTRADEALAWLAGREEGRMVVVSHGFFLRCLVGRALWGEHLSPHVLLRFVYGTRIFNTGLSELLCQEGEEFPWVLVTLNDRAHLGE